MQTESLEKRVATAYKEVYGVCPSPSNGIACALFVKVYDAAPHVFSIGSKRITRTLPEGREWCDDQEGFRVKALDHSGNADCYKTSANLLAAYPDAYLDRSYADAYLWTDKFVVSLPDCTFWSTECDLDEKAKACIVVKEDTPEMKYVTHSSNGFRSVWMSVKDMDVDLNLNYNDDLPHEEITRVINSDESGIIILHGVPGCGKTSYIRHLIAKNKDKQFIFLDSSTFAYISDSSFIELLTSNKSSVFVIEDCEDLLTSRDTRGNYKISALLNLSDGILGDSLNLKFICTFNADIDSIDKALLRKGRLKVKYEFGKLTTAKTVTLAAKLNKPLPNPEPMALCDIYNLGTENGGEQLLNERPKIGFR